MPTQVELIKKYRIQVKGHIGQHLLIDPNAQKKIVDLLQAKKNEVVIEIGCGLGALTRVLLENGCRVIGIEKDRQFISILKQEFVSLLGQEFILVEGDVLKADFSEIFKMAQKMSKSQKKFKIIGNLPYYITAPILFQLLDYSDQIEKAVLTMQKEVADRILANPGNKDYGRLSITARYKTQVRQGMDLPPECFVPRPQVHSTVLMFDFNAPNDRPDPKIEEIFFELVKISFGQRRKTLLSLMAHYPKWKLARERIENIFQKRGLGLQVRGEELLLKDYLNLAEDLRLEIKEP